nr:hypothetical protein [Tanacetum cinerariifolium]
GPARLVVIREPDSGRFQLLPEIQGKGKKKRRTLMPVKASGPAESPSLDAKLALTDSETESDVKVPKINTVDQDKGQAGPNPGIQDEVRAGANPGVQDEGQAGSNPDEDFTTTAYPNVQENLKLPSEDLVILEEPASSTGTLSSLQNLEKELSFTNQFFVSKAVNEIVTNAVYWAMQAPLRARFSDLPTIDMKEILQQRMFESKFYKAHEDHKKLYDALEKLLERDYSDQLLSDLKEACQKRIWYSRYFRSIRIFLVPPPPPPPSTGTSRSTQQQGSKALSSSKSAASTPQSMAWTTSVIPPNWPAAKYWVRGVLLHGSTIRYIY